MISECRFKTCPVKTKSSVNEWTSREYEFIIQKDLWQHIFVLHGGDPWYENVFPLPGLFSFVTGSNCSPDSFTIGTVIPPYPDLTGTPPKKSSSSSLLGFVTEKKLETQGQ